MSYALAYRTGGTANFIWHRAGPYRTEAEAENARIGVQAQGYACTEPILWDRSAALIDAMQAKYHLPIYTGEGSIINA